MSERHYEYNQEDTSKWMIKILKISIIYKNLSRLKLRGIFYKIQ